MSTITEAIVAAAIAKGAAATSKADTITDAIDLLTDTLAGEDKSAGATIAEAIAALTPYIGTVTPTGTKSITANGTGIDVAAYETVDVAVPNPSTGTLEITEDGTYDVTAYASVHVTVSGQL